MKSLLKILDEKLELFICAVTTTGILIVTVLAVFFRYVLNNSLSWGEEVPVYLFTWFVFIAISYGSKMGTHLRVDALVNILPKNIRRVFNIFAGLCLLIFFIYMSVSGSIAVREIMETKAKSPAIQMPLWFLYLSFLLGSMLSTFRIIQNMHKEFIRYRASHRGGTVDGR